MRISGQKTCPDKPSDSSEEKPDAFDRWMEGMDWDFLDEKDEGDQFDLL